MELTDVHLSTTIHASVLLHQLFRLVLKLKLNALEAVFVGANILSK